MLSTSPHTEITARADGALVARPALVWTEVVEQACTLLAEGRPVKEVALECDVSTKTIKAWLAEKQFQDRMYEYAERYRAEVMGYAIARVECRVAGYQDTWEKIQRIKRERGEELDGQAPGAGTGLLTHDKKSLGKGDDAQIIDVYEVDTALLREERELLKQAAQDLGQWAEKRVLTGEGGGPVQVQAMALAELMTPDELETLRKRLAEKQAAQGVVVEDGVEVLPAAEAAEEFPA